jgi:M6 family metalloprotease-like protein
VKNKKWIIAILLLLLTISAAAQDVVVQRGCRVGTPRPKGMVLRRGAPDSQPKQTGGDFYYGERHQLTVMVEFKDRAFKGDEDATLAQWNLIFNAKDLSAPPFKGSVHDYFYAQSYGVFELTFDLVYVKVEGNVEKYASTAAHDENSQYLVQDIMEVLSTRNIDWSLYDWNGDGFVNQLLIVYAGQGMNNYDKEEYKDKAMIWPHQWWMSEHLKDGQSEVYCDPIPVTYNDKEYKVDCYCALAELTKNNDYGSFGTLCHEYTHCFGFPDFYNDTSYVGSWELMDYGNYNGSGYSPAGYSAHERWMMGWLTPTELSTATTVTNIPTLSDEPQAYLIRNDGHQDEYYIVENRQKKGWDAGLPGSGVIIFHVDYDPDLWVSTTTYPNTKKDKHYIIIPANNNSTAKTSNYPNWSYPYQNNDSLTNHSQPAATLNNENTDGTYLMNKSLRDISVTNGLASFRFTIDGTTGIENMIDRKPMGPTKVLYQMGPVLIVREQDGTIRKIMKR